MTSPAKFRKDKEIVAEYETQVKGKILVYFFLKKGALLCRWRERNASGKLLELQGASPRLARLHACLYPSPPGKASLVFVLTRHLWGLIDVCGRGGSIIYQSTVIRKQDVMIGGVSSRWRQLAQPTKTHAHTHTQKTLLREISVPLQMWHIWGFSRKCCAFHTCVVYCLGSSAQRGRGFDAEQGVFSPCSTSLRRVSHCWCAAPECRRSVRVCVRAASAEITGRDG